MDNIRLNNNLTIGGRQVVNLNCSPLVENKPHFLQATVLPGIGMNLLQIKAFLPSLGEINLLHSPSLLDTKDILENPKNLFGNAAFTLGGALLLPFANRIRGHLSEDGRFLRSKIAGQDIYLPANWPMGPTDREKLAIHGLLYNAKFTVTKFMPKGREAQLVAKLLNTNFNGNWVGKADISVEVILSSDMLSIKITAINASKQILPMGIGLHPYFNIPSQQREQVCLYLPAQDRVITNNYQDVFPMGQLQAVKDTVFDFSAKPARPLNDLFLDDCFTNLLRDARGLATAAIIDKIANYGLKIHMWSPEIKSIQVYAPQNENFVAIEPQFNLADPFNDLWGNTDTGMILLEPGRVVSWHVALELFDPSKEIDHEI